MKNKRLIGIILAVVIILLIPLIAMQFTDEVDWALSDFIAAGSLLLGIGLTCELVMRKVRNVNYRHGLVAVLIALLILIWVEMAVGIFGSPIAGS